MGAVVKQIKDDLDAFLEEDNPLTRQLQKIEEATQGQVKRAQVVYSVMALTSIYLVFGKTAELVSKLIGFVYPAYRSIRALQTEENKDDDTEWLTYWVIFGIMQLLTFWSNSIMEYFPIYWLAQSVFFIWLYLPQTRGAFTLYGIGHAIKVKRDEGVGAASCGSPAPPADSPAPSADSPAAPADIQAHDPNNPAPDAAPFVPDDAAPPA